VLVAPVGGEPVCDDCLSSSSSIFSQRSQSTSSFTYPIYGHFLLVVVGGIVVDAQGVVYPEVVDIAHGGTVSLFRYKSKLGWVPL